MALAWPFNTGFTVLGTVYVLAGVGGRGTRDAVASPLLRITGMMLEPWRSEHEALGEEKGGRGEKRVERKKLKGGGEKKGGRKTAGEKKDALGIEPRTFRMVGRKAQAMMHAAS